MIFTSRLYKMISCTIQFYFTLVPVISVRALERAKASGKHVSLPGDDYDGRPGLFKKMKTWNLFDSIDIYVTFLIFLFHACVCFEKKVQFLFHNAPDK